MAIYSARYKTPQYGEKAYERAYQDWQTGTAKYSDLISSAATDVRGAVGEARELRDYYKPGGGYGTGLRQEAREEVGKGVARSAVQSVQAGMSSQFGSRGINVLAAAELSKLYANIEDTRNQLLTQAFAPYAQMIATLGQLASTGGQLAASQPSRGAYITPGKAQVTGYSRTF